MKARVGINGFGRIGKAVLRIALEHDRDIDIIAINSTSGPQNHAHIFKYDSLYGKINEEIRATEDALYIGVKFLMQGCQRGYCSAYADGC
jgi:glyceraldehyde 3-phosphate dehydrogenase